MSDVVYTDFKPTIIFSYDIIFCLHLVRFSQAHYIVIGINTLYPKYIIRYHLSKEKITDIDNFFGSKLIFICLTKLCPRSSFRQIFGFFFFPFSPFSFWVQLRVSESYHPQTYIFLSSSPFQFHFSPYRSALKCTKGMPPTYSKCICQWQHSRKLKVFQFRKFLTIDNLQKRKVWILDWCYMCNCKGESVDHFFLHCPIAMDLWSMVLVLFGVSWVMLQSIVGLLACWQGKFGHHRNGHIWLIVPHCLMWCLWRERNRCFEDNERSIPDLKLSFFL